MLTFEKSLKILKKWKIPIVKTFYSLELKDLEKAFDRMRKPSVLKVYSPDIIHKTEIGCIYTDIKTKNELREAYEKILKNVFSFNKNARIEAFLLQEKIDGIELIIGAKNDENFGKIILFGLGGIYAEIFKDISIRVLPIKEKDVESMIKQIKGYKILKGYRGKKFNLEALKKLILKTAKLFENENIKEIDFNPVFLNEKEARVVDWKFYGD
ncbi:MAG: acetate--CoA ligase family protein [Candidatus Aenigmatarchaeota archaeon]